MAGVADCTQPATSSPTEFIRIKRTNPGRSIRYSDPYQERSNGLKIRCQKCCQESYSSAKPLVILSGGAYVATEGVDIGMRDHALSYLTCSWRVPADVGGGKLSIDLVSKESGSGGQFDFYFCSIACLRSWFNSKMDDLENLEHDFLEKKYPTI